MGANPLGELLRDAADWIDSHAFGESWSRGTKNSEFVCWGCGTANGSEPAHESTCPIAKLIDRLRLAESELAKAIEAQALADTQRVEHPEWFGATTEALVDMRQTDRPAWFGATSDGTHESRRPVLSKTGPSIPLRFRLIVDEETRRMRLEPGTPETATWLVSNRDAWLAAMQSTSSSLGLTGEMTEELLARVEQTYLTVVRTLDPRAAPVIERYRAAKPPTSP